MYPSGDTQFGREHTAWILEQKGLIGLGQWNEGQEQINQFINELQVGDIVGVVIGDELLALTQVTDLAYQMPNVCMGEYTVVKNETDDRLKWLVNRCPVKVLDWNISKKLPKLSQERSKTLVRIADINKQSNEIIIEWFEKIKESYRQRGLINMDFSSD